MLKDIVGVHGNKTGKSWDLAFDAQVYVLNKY